MNIFIPGTDARMQAAKTEALARGHTLAEAMDCDIALLPLPDSSSAAAPLLSLAGQKRRVYHGRLHPSQKKALANRGWQLINLQEDDAYIRENALISAEGALHAAMTRVDFALRGALCAVVGYGRIGQELTRLLLALGARVRVIARREESRQLAEKDGAQAFDIARMAEALHGAQVLFNTVPSQIIAPDALHALSSGALIMELASPPYGFDLEAARALGFDAVLESGLPSRYAPRTAARLLMDHLEAGEQHG